MHGPDTGSGRNSSSRSGSDPDDLDSLLAAIHSHIEATEELPVDARAGRWLGEAQAVAADLTADPPANVVATRIAQVRQLLEAVGESGTAEVDDRVAAALEVVDEVESRIEE